MVMVVVDDSSLPVDSRPKSYVVGLVAAWRCSTVITWTEWTLAVTLWWWWQHYKYHPGYYYYYYYSAIMRCCRHVLTSEFGTWEIRQTSFSVLTTTLSTRLLDRGFVLSAFVT